MQFSEMAVGRQSMRFILKDLFQCKWSLRFKPWTKYLYLLNHLIGWKAILKKFDYKTCCTLLIYVDLPKTFCQYQVSYLLTPGPDWTQYLTQIGPFLSPLLMSLFLIELITFPQWLKSLSVATSIYSSRFKKGSLMSCQFSACLLVKLYIC